MLSGGDECDEQGCRLRVDESKRIRTGAAGGPTAIIFDLDNTLVHSQIDFAGIRRDLGTLLLVSGVIQEPVLTEGPRRRSIGQIIELGETHDLAHGTALGAEMWRIVEAYEAAGMELASVEADAGPTLAELRRRGHPLGILTNNAQSAALAALRQFELLEHLDPVLGREQAGEMKPSGRGLYVARQHLGARATRLVMVGDSYLDALAARAAGAPYVAFRPRPGELEDHRVEPLAIIDRLEALLDLAL
jgi:phosphoglycolate phosphatase